MLKILSQSHENVLVIKVEDKLTECDYQEAMIPLVDEIVSKYGTIRIVVQFDPSFKGWEFKAAFLDSKIGLTHRKDFEKMALVGAKPWIEKFSKFFSHFIPGELQIFPEEGFNEAVEWISI